MPELPEAENIGRALKRSICGGTIAKVEVFTPAMRTPLTPLKSAGLEGCRIVDIRRRARYLVAELDDGRGLLMHFGMSGVIRVEPESVPRRKHEHVFIHFTDGKIFRFECTRRFSLLEVHPGCANGAFPAVLDKLGVEPLSEEFSGKLLFEHFKKRSGCVKNALMDNAIVVGIGNIYANETLFECAIDPRRSANAVTLKECCQLADTARKILLRAIECGGTTISDFKNVDGSEGKFVQELKIYGRNGETCPRCSAVIASVRLGGRNSFYCPGCQK
ncbi:MAG: bifunctional DNA-formamidopyrimidine glycosylase/DNA-(apurinic or apyrimidinic site) lyase [Lentisphaerae bacterium]|nr:bifunctional DNA-formamidopyrimidine glycosylase/DNA-(apurinic or apyrimidinic site) lyase [Lentisphaerota bacterium]